MASAYHLLLRLGGLYIPHCLLESRDWTRLAYLLKTFLFQVSVLGVFLYSGPAGLRGLQGSQRDCKQNPEVSIPRTAGRRQGRARKREVVSC